MEATLVRLQVLSASAGHRALHAFEGLCQAVLCCVAAIAVDAKHLRNERGTGIYKRMRNECKAMAQP